VEVSHEHLLWNQQQVLERYGKPDEILGGGQWLYRRTVPGSANEEEVTFVFHDGLVRGVYF
jgi:hypothetical protein